MLPPGDNYAYTFTVNNWVPEDDTKLQEWAASKCKYMIYGKEVGESGTPHLQGFARMKNQINAKNFIKKAFVTAPHLEVPKGTDHHNKTYCSKESVAFEFGEPSFMGQRKDIEGICAEIKKKRKMEEIVMENPEIFVKFHRGFEYVARAHVPERSWKTEVYVYYGPTNCSKTWTAMQEAPDAWVRTPDHGAWFDGYCGQDDAIFEEFRGDIKFCQLLMLLDRYKMQVPVKGGFVNWCPKRIFITSPKPPQEWYMNIEDKRQLYRRITLQKEFNVEFKDL